MLQTILLSVARQARRHPLFISLNIAGLALGLAVFLSLIQLVRYEYATNSGFAGYAHIARLDEHWSEPGTTPYESGDATFRILDFLTRDYPEIEAAAPYLGGRIQVLQGAQSITLHKVTTRPEFFRIFALPFRAGTPDHALSRPDAAVLTREAAQILFGTDQVMGRTIDTNSYGSKKRYTITGIVDHVPSPSFMDDAQIFLPVTEETQALSCFSQWGSSCGELFVRLRPGADLARLNRSFPAFITRHAAGPSTIRSTLGPDPNRTYALSLMPLASMHFDDLRVEDIDDGVSKSVIDSIGLVGLLALVLACANAINLATARSGLRAREVALRKTLGAPRAALFVQFTGESLVLAFFSGLIALALCEILIPFMASTTGEAITIGYGFVALVLPFLVVASGLVSGLYPALILSGYRPASILASTRMPSGGRAASALRNALVTGQFAIAVCIVICTLVIAEQTQFTRIADKGYAKEGLLIGQQMQAAGIDRQRLMLERLRALPGVTSVTLGELEPNPHSQSRSTIEYTAPSGAHDAQLLIDQVTPGYLETYRPRLLAGRWFDLAHGKDDSPEAPGAESPDPVPGERSVVLNEKAVQAFGVADPREMVGKTVREGYRTMRIIGVIADMRFGPPRQALPPSMILFSTLGKGALVEPIPAIRYHGIDRKLMQERLDRTWASVLPDIPSHFSPAEDKMADYYSGDEKRSELFSAGAAAALFIACLGLYGLGAFAAARRVHEIGIRKTLGATALQIVTLLLKDFLRPVILACLVATPVALFLMRSWLSGFDERISLGPAVFLIAVGGALAIAALTVLGQTLRLARSAPSHALRAE